MKRDPKGEALRWLRQAEIEFDDAKRLREAKRFYLALFLYQQVAEKALKAFLYAKGEEALFSHSIHELLNAATYYDTDFQKIKKAKRLDDYYIPTRYPNGLPGGVPAEYYDDENEAVEAEQVAQGLIELVQGKLREAGIL